MKIGSFRDDGDRIFVNNSLELKHFDNWASRMTFQIATDAGIPSPNNYVVGMARKQEGDLPVPVAAVELKPGADYFFTPSETVFVRATNLEPGLIHTFHNANDENVAKVVFRGTHTQAVVTELSNGTFTVTYRCTVQHCELISLIVGKPT